MATEQSSTDINFEKMKMKELKSLTAEQNLSGNILNLETNNAHTFTIGTLFTGIG